MNEESDIKDFSRPRPRIRFKIDGDVFEAAPAIPADVLVEFASRFGDLDSVAHGERLGVLTSVLDMVLLPESYALLRKRMSDREHPVELDQLSEVIVHLMEKYGLRPTQPSADSLPGLPSLASGTSSTDGALDGASTSRNFLPTGS